MKNIFAWIAGTILLLTPIIVSAGNSKIIMLSDPWVPWVEGKEGETAQKGIAVDIVKEILKRAEVPVELKLYPWKRCLHYAQKGSVDGLFFLSKNMERETYLIFTEPFVVSSYIIYYSSERKAPFKWKKWGDLKAYRIGTCDDYNYGDNFINASKEYNYKIDPAHTDLLSIKKLIAGRVDIIILNRSTADSIIDNNPEFKGKIISAEKPLDTASYYMAFSKKSKNLELLPGINEIIEEMKTDGTIDKFLNIKKAADKSKSVDFSE